MDGAGFHLVVAATAPVIGVETPRDPGSFQARCIEDYQASQAVRGFSTLTIDNGAATLERFLAACGRPAEKILRPMQPGDVPATWADTALLAELTGHSPKTPLAEGMARFVAWYRDYHGV